MSWVTENKFLAGFSAVMLVGVGTLGWLTYSAMDKSDAATAAYDSANAQLKRLRDSKPSLTDAHLKELIAQKQELSDKMEKFRKDLQAHVLPLPAEPPKPAQFQDELKKVVAQVSAKAANAHVDLPKDFYLGFSNYHSEPPKDAAAPVLMRELQAVELVMNAFIKAGTQTGGLTLEEFERDPLPEEGKARTDGQRGGSGRRRGGGGGDRSDQEVIERNGIRVKFTSNDEALRSVLTNLANDKQQLFIIRNVAVQNKLQDSPPRVGGAAPVPVVPDATPSAPGTPQTPAPGGTPPALAASPAPAPQQAAPAADEGPLSYVFGTEKITSTLELEVLNIEEPKPKSDTPEKDGKSKDKPKKK